MFCIAAFIVLAILGIFSARYRKLAARAWQCVAKKLTFRKCDINFGEEVKGKMLGKIIVTHPRVARFLNKWIDFLAFVFVILSIWSLIYVAIAGLNLFVYDTCKPQSGQSCSLSGEACSISAEQIGFWQSVKTNKEGTWLKQDVKNFIQTISLVPSRLRSWDPKKYLSPKPTFYNPYDASKPTALEILDPGCQYCAKLFGNIRQANFEDRYNFSYVVYPIKDSTTSSGWKFTNSYLIASFLEASKDVVPEKPVSQISPDWQILDKIFSGNDPSGQPWQNEFNLVLTPTEAMQTLQSFLKETGYSDTQVQQITTLSQSQEIKDRLSRQRNIVEKQIHTTKIPTILFDGRRYDRVVDVNKLSK